MKRIKVIIAAFLMLAMTVGMFAALGGEKAQAATKPAKAKVTAKANDDGTSVTLTIAKTKKAQGYQIMVKKPGAKKFTKLATISEDGTAKRTYTAKKMTEGEYQFKVRAYLKNGKKTVWGKYSKVAKVKVESKAAEDTGKDDKDNSGNVNEITDWNAALVGTWEYIKKDGAMTTYLFYKFFQDGRYLYYVNSKWGLTLEDARKEFSELGSPDQYNTYSYDGKELGCSFGMFNMTTGEYVYSSAYSWSVELNGDQFIRSGDEVFNRVTE